jgi:hypothetical protein
MGPDAMNDADINFYFDPLCPFAWMTSKGVRQVAAQRDYSVARWFISLRTINADVDYDSRFPAGYDAGHTVRPRLLRWPPGLAPSTAAPARRASRRTGTPEASA